MASATSLMSSRKPSSLLTLTGSLSLLEKSLSSVAASASSSRSVFNTCFSFGNCGIEIRVSLGLWLTSWVTVFIAASVLSREAMTASTSLSASGSLGLIRKCFQTLYSLAAKAERQHEGKC